MEEQIAKAISRHTIWAEKSILDAYNRIGSWDKTLIACENAAILNMDLKSMAFIIADKTRQFWPRYGMGDDGRVGTRQPPTLEATSQES